jgi:hypothetical protein
MTPAAFFTLSGSTGNVSEREAHQAQLAHLPNSSQEVAHYPNCGRALANARYKRVKEGKADGANSESVLEGLQDGTGL